MDEVAYIAWFIQRSNWDELFEVVQIVKSALTPKRKREAPKARVISVEERERNQRRALVRELSLRAVPRTTQGRLGGDCLGRILRRHKLELRAMEMDARHAFATTAQLVAAIKPHVFNLRDSVSVNRVRHEMFMEKTSSEPRQHFIRASVRSSIAAREKLFLAIFCEMRSQCLYSSRNGSGRFSKVLGDPHLCFGIYTYLDPISILSLGTCSSEWSGAREIGQLVAFLLDLRKAYDSVTRDDIWFEHALTAIDEVANDVELGHHVFAQRNPADCIAKFWRASVGTEFKDEPVDMNERPITKKLSSSVESESRFSTFRGLFVVRKQAFGGSMEVPMPM